jgi:protocatechuate 3,4-dioxygenase beta subunit
MTPVGDHDPFEPGNHEVSHALLSRRRMLVAAGAGVVAGVGAAAWLGAGGEAEPAADDGVGAAAATPSAGAGADLCMLTTEQVEGPYYLDLGLFRRDVRERKAGVPLRLDIDVVDAATCRPLGDAAVEIWHCDAAGVYSGYAAVLAGPAARPSARPTGQPPSVVARPSREPAPRGTGTPPDGGRHLEPTDDLTFLRGTQLTRANGKVRFVTIVPGWYAGRAVHIHTKVHLGGTRTPDGYEGGDVAHTGQLYLPEAFLRRVAALTPYRRNATPRTPLADDPVSPGGGAAGGELTVKSIGTPRASVSGHPVVTASIRLGVRTTGAAG